MLQLAKREIIAIYQNKTKLSLYCTNKNILAEHKKL